MLYRLSSGIEGPHREDELNAGVRYKMKVNYNTNAAIYLAVHVFFNKQPFYKQPQ